VFRETAAISRSRLFKTLHTPSSIHMQIQETYMKFWRTSLQASREIWWPVPTEIQASRSETPRCGGRCSHMEILERKREIRYKVARPRRTPLDGKTTGPSSSFRRGCGLLMICRKKQWEERMRCQQAGNNAWRRPRAAVAAAAWREDNLAEQLLCHAYGGKGNWSRWRALTDWTSQLGVY
jgi:hypothetical protein